MYLVNMREGSLHSWLMISDQWFVERMEVIPGKIYLTEFKHREIKYRTGDLRMWSAQSSFWLHITPLDLSWHCAVSVVRLTAPLLSSISSYPMRPCCIVLTAYRIYSYHDIGCSQLGLSFYRFQIMKYSTNDNNDGWLAFTLHGACCPTISGALFLLCIYQAT